MGWHDRIEDMDACEEAVNYLRGYDDPQQAWDECERGDWMLWLLGWLSGKPESKSRHKLVLIACECAGLALPHVPDSEERPRQAIDTARRWAQGDPTVTLDDVSNAATAAADAAAATWAAAYAAATAYAYAYAAAYAAAATAVHAAADAADAATWAAYAAAREDTLRQCADIVRKHSPKWLGFGVGAWVRQGGE